MTPPLFTAVPELTGSESFVGIGVFDDLTTTSSIDLDVSYLRARRFEGKAGQFDTLPQASGGVLVTVGLGNRDLFDERALRKAVAAFVRAGWKQAAAFFVLGDLPGVDVARASALVAESAMLTSYTFGAYKSEPKVCELETVAVVGGEADAIERGSAIGRAVRLARDMINDPPQSMTPTRIGELAAELGAGSGLAVEVWDKDRIISERLGGLLGVAQGSAQPPRLVRLTWNPPGATRHVALVGKGITFDSGGLSIKPADGMMTMKADMSGAAAVLAAMTLCETLGVTSRVEGYLCCTENLPSGTAIKPSDVVRFRNGKTAEVLNTDAEGRLVLADGLSLAVEDGADTVLDVATLTGAVVVALGREIAGLMGNDPALLDDIKAAGERAGEAFWGLPLPERYEKHIESEIADIKNIGKGGEAGTLTAGLFLQHFVGNTKWAHLDIAGAARAESDEGEVTKGGTGFAVRTLAEWLQSV